MEVAKGANVDRFIDRRVIEVIDRYNLTPLTSLIIHFLTDPSEEHSSKKIVSSCQSLLGMGSKRHVRRIRQEMRKIVDEVHLAREMDHLTEVDGDGFTTVGMIDGGGDGGGNGLEMSVPGGAETGLQDSGVKEDDDGFWDVTEELDCVTACSKAPENGFVYISAIAWKKIKLYMKWAGHQEWLCYLIGEFTKENTVEVSDILLPSQSATQTLVSEVNVDEYKGIVGVIHSHHEMGGAKGDKAGFSGHDEAFINSNHNVSLLVARDGIAGHIRVKTPCGAFLRITAKIKQMDEVDLDEKKLKEEFQSKIRFGRSARGSSWNDPPQRGTYDPKKTYHF